MTRRRIWHLSLALVIALAIVTAGWPAHRHAASQSSACNLCLLAQLPVIQAPATAGLHPPLTRAWHRAVHGSDRQTEAVAVSRPTRAPPA